jgi:DNA-binding IclR family transcriptional regulator
MLAFLLFGLDVRRSRRPLMTELETPAMPRRADLTSAAVVAGHHPSVGERTAVDKALEVLAAFPPGQVPVGVSELARDLALTKSTVFRLLSALERNGFVERVEGRYRLGAGLHDLGARVYEPVPGALHAALVPLMAVLYERTRENVNLGVLREGEVVLLGRLHGPRPVPRALPIGTRFPAHSSAMGKAMLAHDPVSAQRVLAAGLRPRTRDTIISDRRFRAALDRIRESGLATSVREARPELSCVATALLDGAGRPIAALSIGGATGRFAMPEHAELLRRVAVEATAAARRARGTEAEQARVS